MAGATFVILAIAIGGYAFLSLSGPMNYYLDRTAEAAASGSVFAGEGLVLNASTVDWGVLEPDTSANRTFRISNLLDEPMKLNLATSNWDPTNATEYMGLSWDDDGTPLLGLAYRDVTLTLNVYANVTGITNFYFDITIGGDWT